MLSHMLDCQLFGLKPWGHHLTSVLLPCTQHSSGLSAASQPDRRAVAERAGGGAVRAASVARGIGGMGGGTQGCAQHLFGLLALMFYGRYARRAGVRNAEAGDRSPPFPTLLAVFVVLRPWLDEQADAGDVAVRPVAAGLLAAASVSNQAQVWSLVMEKIPFVALAEAACVATFVAQKQSGAVMTMEDLPLGARGGNALISCCRYLGKCSGRRIWPFSIRIPDIGRRRRCCWRACFYAAFRRFVL